MRWAVANPAMWEVALHAGVEHPNLTWILIPSIITFISGLAIGHYAGRIRSWLTTSGHVID